MQLRSGAVVSHLEMDAAGRLAEAVVLVDAASGRRERLAAPLVVLCASTIETVRLLLHSSDAMRSGGLSDPSGSLGRYLMDHISTSRFFSIPAIEAPPNRPSSPGPAVASSPIP